MLLPLLLLSSLIIRSFSSFATSLSIPRNNSILLPEPSNQPSPSFKSSRLPCLGWSAAFLSSGRPPGNPASLPIPKNSQEKKKPLLPSVCLRPPLPLSDQPLRTLPFGNQSTSNLAPAGTTSSRTPTHLPFSAIPPNPKYSKRPPSPQDTQNIPTSHADAYTCRARPSNLQVTDRLDKKHLGTQRQTLILTLLVSLARPKSAENISLPVRHLLPYSPPFHKSTPKPSTLPTDHTFPPAIITFINPQPPVACRVLNIPLSARPFLDGGFCRTLPASFLRINHQPWKTSIFLSFLKTNTIDLDPILIDSSPHTDPF